jgi:steroid delta-isomerase-like uncharacterized protein
MAIVRRFWDAVENGGDLAIADALIAPSFVFYNAANPHLGQGPEAVRRWVAPYRLAFPDQRFTVEAQVADAHRLVTRWTKRATHLGPFLGRPATGRQVEYTGLYLDELRDGRLVGHWDEADILWLVQQLGFVPALGEA